MIFRKKQIPVHKIKRLLLVRPDAIGDMVLMIPVLKAIRKKYPSIHITILASHYNSRIIKHLDLFDDIIYKTYIKSFKEFWSYVSFLKSKTYDVAIHFGIRDYIVWPCFFSIPINIGDKSLLSLWPIFRKYGVFYRNHDRPKHVCEYHFILAKALGISLSNEEDLEIPAPPGSIDEARDLLTQHGYTGTKPLIGIQVGVGFGNRPVKPEKYARYINALRQKMDVDVCISGYSDIELEFCSVIESHVDAPVITLKKVPIELFMGVITLFDVFVSVDTGPFHLGAALKVPQLAIFPSKKVKPLSWGPYRNRHFVVRNTKNCTYDCPHQGCPYDVCSDDISETDMITKTIALLNGGGVSTKKEQREHWFSMCMTILVLWDEQSKERNEFLYRTLTKWGFIVHSLYYADSGVEKFIREHDIAIVHNLSGKRRWRLFLSGQRVIKYIYHSPLWIHDDVKFESKDDLIQYYSNKFSQKIL